MDCRQSNLIAFNSSFINLELIMINEWYVKKMEYVLMSFGLFLRVELTIRHLSAAENILID